MAILMLEVGGGFRCDNNVRDYTSTPQQKTTGHHFSASRLVHCDLADSLMYIQFCDGVLGFLPLKHRVINGNSNECDDQSGPSELRLIDNQQQAESSTHRDVDKR